MMDLSPRLLERRRHRETRVRPWKDTKPTLSPLPRCSTVIPSPSFRPTEKTYLRRSENARRTLAYPTRYQFRRSGPFPFRDLPFEIQLAIGEHVVQSRSPMRCRDFISYKDGKLDKDEKTKPMRALSKTGRPVWIPLLQVCPWLSKDLTRAWYRSNIFIAKSVPDWQAFCRNATWDNVKRITHLQVDNELIYCPGESIGESEDWRSYSLLTPMENLQTLTLFRDDGGPSTYTTAGHDDFNSVEWFVRFAEDCRKLQHIKFALYPWTGFDAYALATSNMVSWIKDWEHEWQDVLSSRRSKVEKPTQNWYLTASPLTKPAVPGGARH